MWAPHLTVAVIVEKEGQFLIVEEIDNNKTVINQPAGHVEENESILQAAIRETLEETCWEVELRYCLGISRFIANNGLTYFRHSFAADAIVERDDISRDADITAVYWMSDQEIRQKESMHRSKMVLQDLDTYKNGTQYPLDLYNDI